MIVKLSYLEMPLDKAGALKDNMYITAMPLYKEISMEFSALARFVASDARQISPFTYTGGKKITEQWNNDKQDLIIMDFDDGYSIAECQQRFKAYQYLIYTTKSHQVEKKGLTCDRYRLILIGKNIPRGDEYFDVMREVESSFDIDKQVNNKTGAFLCNGNCEIYENDGKKFDMNFYKILRSLNSSILTSKQQQHQQPPSNMYQHDNFYNMPSAQVRQHPMQSANRHGQKQYPRININEVKALLTQEIVADIVRSLGFNVDRKFKFKMRPDEKTASASIAPATKDLTIKDFGGDFNGDVFQFVEQQKGLKFYEALEYVADFVGIKKGF